jgi:CTP-dependent riboflavin kinase
VELRGEVSSGLGRAHIFMAQSHYQEQFKQVLGVTAWPGTLNIQLKGESLAHYIALRKVAGVGVKGITDEIKERAALLDVGDMEPHRINGFEREGRSFGGATAFIATLSVADSDDDVAVPCAILIPDLTRHVEVVEVIAAAFLRELLDLSDGDVAILTA